MAVALFHRIAIPFTRPIRRCVTPQRFIARHFTAAAATRSHPKSMAAAAAAAAGDAKAAGNGSAKPRLLFVSGNKKKLQEVREILTEYDVQSNPIDLPELQGEPEEVSIEKCKLAFEKLQAPVIVEDTSLCYNALGGLPGVYIKWFLEKTGHVGLNNLLAAYPDKTAYAQCIFSFAAPGHKPIAFVGRCNGRIVPARGPLDFGWDPVFEPTGHAQTYAEMDKALKNQISHRSLSLAKLKEFLKTHAHLLTATPAPAADAPAAKKRKSEDAAAAPAAGAAAAAAK